MVTKSYSYNLIKANNLITIIQFNNKVPANSIRQKFTDHCLVTRSNTNFKNKKELKTTIKKTLTNII